MNEHKLLRLTAGLDKWKEDFGMGMERRGADGLSWYDLSINMNSLPCEKDLAIIVTCWFGQLKWLARTLESYRKTGALVIMSYDNPFYAWVPKTPDQMMRCMPNPSHYLLAHQIVHKHITYDSDKRNGWFWNMRCAQGLLKNYPNIKYVYFTNGDCGVDKPEGFKDLIAYMGDNDIMAGQNNGDTLHTADVLCRHDAFDRIFDYMAEEMRVPVLGSRSPEGLLREAVAATGSKVKFVDQNPLDRDGTIDMYARYAPDSTFKKLIGFRNVFAEYETAGNNGEEMMYLKPWVDDYNDYLYWAGEEKETICQYWKTGDRRYLMKFWDQWEDSDYNRLYYPLHFYGKEPILERNDG